MSNAEVERIAGRLGAILPWSRGVDPTAVAEEVCKILAEDRKRLGEEIAAAIKDEARWGRHVEGEGRARYDSARIALEVAGVAQILCTCHLDRVRPRLVDTCSLHTDGHGRSKSFSRR